MADLFDLVDLAATLQSDLDTASASEARRKAQAWLASATQLSEWPTPVPEDLRAWALELAAYAYDNPSNLTNLTIDGTTSTWGTSGDASVRDRVLAAAAAKYAAAAAQVKSGPQAVFPVPARWPDPAELDRSYPYPYLL